MTTSHADLRARAESLLAADATWRRNAAADPSDYDARAMAAAGKLIGEEAAPLIRDMLAALPGEAVGMEGVDDAIDAYALACRRSARADAEDDGLSKHRDDVARAASSECVATRTALLAAIRSLRGLLTVGAALAGVPALPKDWTHAIEWLDGGSWFRLAPGQPAHCDEPTIVFSVWGKREGWSYEDETPFSLHHEVYPLPCRLVPIADADRDPSERGSL